jgi:hypothetical protein
LLIPADWITDAIPATNRSALTRIAMSGADSPTAGPTISGTVTAA